MAVSPVPEESELAHQTIEEADRFDRLTFAALITDGETIVASGSTVIEPGAKLIVMGTPDGIQIAVARNPTTSVVGGIACEGLVPTATNEDCPWRATDSP